MSDYKKKKQLLEDNKDMYISEYDKTLSYDALNRIVAAKKDFINAAKTNDKTGMTRANDIANAVRAKYGNYTGGEDGSEFHPFNYTEDGFDEYESKYEDELDNLYSLIMDSDREFSYDYEEDPVYQSYKDIYNKQGSLAYDRALAENSLRTGGMENTHAQSAAMQAMNYYNSQLAAKIPELYRAAYERYYTDRQNDYKRLLDSYDIIKNRENRDYERYLNKIDNERNVRDFLYKQKSDIDNRNFAREEREAGELAALNKIDAQRRADLELQKSNHAFDMEKSNANRLANMELEDAKHRYSLEELAAAFANDQKMHELNYNADKNLQEAKHRNNLEEIAATFNNDKEMQNLEHMSDLEKENAKHKYAIEEGKADLESKLALENAGYISDLNLQNDRQEYDSTQNNYDRDLESKELMYKILKNAIDDEKWRSEYNMDAHKNGFGYYQGLIGTGNILDYARMIFEDESLTMEDLYRLLDI